MSHAHPAEASDQLQLCRAANKDLTVWPKPVEIKLWEFDGGWLMVISWGSMGFNGDLIWCGDLVKYHEDIIQNNEDMWWKHYTANQLHLISMLYIYISYIPTRWGCQLTGGAHLVWIQWDPMGLFMVSTWVLQCMGMMGGSWGDEHLFARYVAVNQKGTAF